MTAISFILGLLPLVVAMGAGAVSRRSVGFAVVGGMLFAVLFGTFLIPSFYVVMQKLIDLRRKRPEITFVWS
jgi:HAE1 family hydrophobic/amphiphilic exporter-1